MMDARFRPVVDQQRCIGCGLCEETLPEVFRMGDYTAFVVQGPVEGAQAEQLQIAARDCPVGAISLLETESGSEDTDDGSDSAHPVSGNASGDEDEKGENVKERGEIAQYKRKHGDPAQRDEVQPDNTQSLQSGKHNFSIVRNGTHDN